MATGGGSFLADWSYVRTGLDVCRWGLGFDGVCEYGGPDLDQFGWDQLGESFCGGDAGL